MNTVVKCNSANEQLTTTMFKVGKHLIVKTNTGIEMDGKAFTKDEIKRIAELTGYRVTVKKN